MRSRQTRRRSFAGTAFLAVFTLLIVGGGFFGALWAAGYIEFGPTEPSREGQIAYPATARPIPAFTRITREHLINPQTNQLHVMWLPENMRNEKMIRDLGQLIGRVASHDINPNAVLTESNLMPKGTRPGLTAGVPPGKRSMTLEVGKIPGLESLRRGDVFDLLTALPVREESERDSNVEYGMLLGGIKPLDTRAGRLQRQSGVKVLVRGGIMVAHTKGQAQSTEGGSSLVVPATTNRRTNEPNLNATIAVDPSEVMPLTEALGLDVKIFCVAHSGHAENPQMESFPELNLEGFVAVPATVRPVKAFSRITQADLADPITGKLNVYYFSPERVASEWLTEFRDVVGRVVSRDVDAGYVFLQPDLMPPGTPSGLAAAVPEGKVALAVPKGRIQGLDDLHQGDRFDVLSTLPKGMDSLIPPSLDWATIMGGKPSPQDAEIYQQLRTGLRTLVRDAVKLMNDAEGEKTAIAVNPDEVTSLSQMLNREEITLQVVAHPGKQPNLVKHAKEEMVRRGSHSSEALRVEYVSFPEGDSSSEVFVQAPANAAPAERVKAPVTTRPIKAFTRLTIEDFLDPATGEIRFSFFPSEKEKPDWETDITKLIDRVAARDIPGNSRRIQSGDLLPEGTRPGPTAGIRPHERSLSVTSDQLEGLTSYIAGDRIDIVVALPFDDDKLLAKAPWLGELRETVRVVPSLKDIHQQADTYLVARDVTILTMEEVEREEIREVIEESVGQEIIVGSTITKTGIVRTPITRTVQRTLTVATLAMQPEEISIVTEILAIGAELHAAARSGQPANDRSKPLPAAEEKSTEMLPPNSPTILPGEIPQNSSYAKTMQTWREAMAVHVQLEEQERLEREARWAEYREILRGTHGIEEIRGQSHQTRYWLNGRPSRDLPAPPADLLSLQN